MAYNRFHYNTALWNAGRDEVAGIARSVIQAHTGPHVQAVLGASGGTTLISDFIITEGTVVKPPTQYKFPDLTAFIRAYQVSPSSEGTADGLAKNDMATFIRAQQFFDLPTCVFLVNKIPDLPANIFGLLEANLPATIFGLLGQADLPAVIQVLVANLPASMLGIAAPNLPARIFVQPPGNLGARIHSPHDLPAIFTPVQFADLPGAIRGFQFADLPGFMLGVAAPELFAFIRGVAADILNLPARTLPLAFVPGMPATIQPVFTGDTGFSVGLTSQIASAGGFNDVQGIIRSVFETTGDLGALIKTGGELDLVAIINQLGAHNLQGLLGTIPAGEKDAFLNAFAQPVTPADLGATMTLSENVAFLFASIRALSDTADMSARIGVAETFITALLTVSTMASKSLRATIGKPGCAGGADTVFLGGQLVVQHARTLNVAIQSFINKDLGGAINTEDLFFAYDTIDFIFSPRQLPGDPRFKATDTIPVLFSPFRGKNLGAVLNSIQNNVFLNATITATFPLLSVVPAVNRLTVAELRLGEDSDIQEVRLALEGTFLEYLYVNGTDQAFIKDPNEDWKINIRSFRPIAAELFGDQVVSRICRLGSLTTFRTMDEAVRSCIQAVIGFEDEADMSALLTARGSIVELPALVGVSDKFGDLSALANRVFPADFGATAAGTGGYLGLSGFIHPTGSGIIGDLGAFMGIDDIREFDVFATVSGSGNAKILNAFVTASG